MLTKEQFLKDAISLRIRTETEEIFWKLVDKLIELGWEPYTGNRNSLTPNNYIYLPYFSSKSLTIHPRELPDGKKEIPISDILGEESQFEVGKWYEIIATEFEPGEHISKFLKLKDGHFYYSEAIKFGDYSKHSDWHGYANWVREVSLEEIQQYLPGDHPDKLSKLLTIDDLVGGEAYFAKLDKEEWNSLFYCEAPPTFTVRLYVSDKCTGKKYDPGDWSFTKGVNYRLATPEEKQWLNACISEGKFVEKEVALKDYNMHGKALKSEVNEIKQQFKVGDWVYADRQSDGDFRYELGDSYIPIFKVEEIYKPINKGEWLRPIKNKANGIESKYCRLATPEEIAKVTKVVDKPFEFNKWYKYKGQPKYLAFIHKNGRYGFNTDDDWFDQKEPDSIEHFNKHKDSFVLAEDSEVKERLLSYAKEKYPVGTIVKSAQNLSSCWNINTNWVYTGLNRLANFGFAVFYEGKWAEVISKPETKESKEFDRNWYVEVNSQEEADKVFDWLESQGEKIKPGKYTSYSNNYLRKDLYEDVWRFSTNTASKPQRQLSDILPEYKQSIKTEEELSHIIDTNEELRNEIGNLINQRDFKSSDFAQPIIIKSKKQKRNKLIIVNN